MTKLSYAIDEYILSGRADGKSPATISVQRSLLGRFGRAHSGATLGELTTRDLRLYVVDLRDHYTQHTVADHVRVLHAFWAWASTEYGVINQMKGIKRTPMPEPSPRAITESDFVKLFQATGDGLSGYRDRAMIAMLIDTGVRLGGLAGLQVDDVDIVNRRARVLEKGRKSRHVAFSFATSQLIQLWLFQRNQPSPALWTSINDHAPLTTWGIRQVLKRLRQRAGVTGRSNAHSFRHAFAKMYLLNGGDLVTLAKLLGHESIQTTVEYYGVFTADELSDEHNRRSPLMKILRDYQT